MMCLSQTTGYAIQALACLQNPACTPRLIRDIAQCTAIPKPYLAKVINQLSRKGLVSTKRGYRGGIFLTKPAGCISLLEVVIAVEGPKWIGDCLLGLEECEPPRKCPTHAAWLRIREQIEATLRDTNLGDVIQALQGPPVQPVRRPRNAARGPARKETCACAATRPPG